TETLTNPKNKALIADYQKNSESINKLQLALDRNQELIAFIRRSFSEINERIESYNELSVIVPKLPLTNDSFYCETLEKNANEINVSIGNVKLKNEEIKKDFLEQGINQDVSSLLNKLSEYQENIDKAKAKIKEIDENKNRYFAYVKERSEFAGKYCQYIEEQATEIQSLYNSLHIENDSWNEEQNQIVRDILSDINISGKIIFDNEKFYRGLEGCINRGKFRASNEKTTRQKLTDTFNVQSYTDFVKLLNNEKVINPDGEGKAITIEDFFWKSEYFNQGGRYELMHYLF
ncbi:DNA repair protein, partial [Salmonella enterica]|nr:DNA repair protein [Salmonella enterica]